MEINDQWLLFKYVNGEFTPLSKAFKTKDQAEKARLNSRSGSGGKLRWV